MKLEIPVQLGLLGFTAVAALLVLVAKKTMYLPPKRNRRFLPTVSYGRYNCWRLSNQKDWVFEVVSLLGTTVGGRNPPEMYKTLQIRDKLSINWCRISAINSR